MKALNIILFIEIFDFFKIKYSIILHSIMLVYIIFICSKILSLTGNIIEVIILGINSYAKCAKKHNIKIPKTLIILTFFRSYLSPINSLCFKNDKNLKKSK